jgi:hypothetical protein
MCFDVLYSMLLYCQLSKITSQLKFFNFVYFIIRALHLREQSSEDPRIFEKPKGVSEQKFGQRWSSETGIVTCGQPSHGEANIRFSYYCERT